MVLLRIGKVKIYSVKMFINNEYMEDWRLTAKKRGGGKGTDLFLHPVVCKQFRRPSSIVAESPIIIRDLAQLIKVIKQTFNDEVTLAVSNCPYN